MNLVAALSISHDDYQNPVLGMVTPINISDEEFAPYSPSLLLQQCSAHVICKRKRPLQENPVASIQENRDADSNAIDARDARSSKQDLLMSLSGARR
jgi:hypothetical protein